MILRHANKTNTQANISFHTAAEGQSGLRSTVWALQQRLVAPSVLAERRRVRDPLPQELGTPIEPFYKSEQISGFN